MSATRSSTTSTSCRPWRRRARSSSTRRRRSPRGRSSCSPRTAWRRSSTRRRRERKLATIDATCPLVTKVHKEAVRFANEDYDILLIGHEGHEEVIGTSGEAPDHITLVDGPEDVANVEVRDESKVVWLSQTTLSVDETMETVDALKEKFPQLISPPSDDICYATQNRQIAVKQMGAEARPGHRRRLQELLELRSGWSRSRWARARAPPTWWTSPSEIDEAWLEGVTTVGVTSGASVPEVLVEGVLEWLAQRGYEDVEIVKAAEESITFSLPKELRRDLRAEAAELAGKPSGRSTSREQSGHVSGT